MLPLSKQALDELENLQAQLQDLPYVYGVKDILHVAFTQMPSA
jgi:hypothetical protein